MALQVLVPFTGRKNIGGTASLPGGGEMIATVTFEKTTYAELPHKF